MEKDDSAHSSFNKCVNIGFSAVVLIWIFAVVLSETGKTGILWVDQFSSVVFGVTLLLCVLWPIPLMGIIVLAKCFCAPRGSK